MILDAAIGHRQALARPNPTRMLPMTSKEAVLRYRVVGMDCAADAAEIEKAVREIHGVQKVRVSVATQVLTVTSDGSASLESAVERSLVRLGYGTVSLESSPSHGNGADPPTETHVTAAYRRALWIVVLLNVGYGVIEMVGGFLSGSQSLKADALDFLGDGMITFAGLAAIRWSMLWRARAALLQGLFLGALGLVVLGTTAYRIVVQQQPEAGLMGALGVVALVVNVVAAVLLIPHRTGDANVRAVWLFSRNDAIGNVAVVVAAALVAWLRSPWPDLTVAVVVAGLFLHSAISIVRDARTDLRSASG